jgi:hypothetical protein
MIKAIGIVVQGILGYGIQYHLADTKIDREDEELLREQTTRTANQLSSLTDLHQL